MDSDQREREREEYVRNDNYEKQRDFDFRFRKEQANHCHKKIISCNVLIKKPDIKKNIYASF